MVEIAHFEPESVFRAQIERVWPEHRATISALLPHAEVLHVGGTSIPDCLTKGDLDIQVRIPGDVQAAQSKLQTHYDFAGESSGVLAFQPRRGTLPTNIHLTVIGTSLDVHFRFRRVLLERPDMLQAYDDIKRRFEGKPMTEYRAAKDVFFQRLRVTREFRATWIAERK